MANIQLSNKSVSIAKQSEFNDFLTFAPATEQFQLRNALKARLQSMGNTRSHMTELLRLRLSQVRAHLS